MLKWIVIRAFSSQVDDHLFCGVVFRHNVPSKIVQNGLPASGVLSLSANQAIAAVLR
jgi:hypothetical protein